MQLSKHIAFTCIMVFGTHFIHAQCITDQCGDIFADWALLSQEITVCEGATFEVANQTIMPDIDFYVWDWGNGDRDTVYEVSNFFYTYLFDDGTACTADNGFTVFNISLEIYRFCDEGQSCHTQIAPVAIRFRPRASFSIPPIVCAQDTITLSNESCNGNEYLWVLGDGTTSTEENPGHVFDSSGVYDVTLYVTNLCGTDSISQTIEVLDKPVANSSANDSDTAIGCVPLTVSFDNFSAFADNFNWTFPDSAGVVYLDTFNAQSPAPTVEFTIPGTYTVSLSAENACGSNEWTTTITVLAPPDLSLDPLPDACDSISIALGDYVNANGDIDHYSWTAAGPNVPDIPSTANPLVSFGQTGNYQIGLTVSNDYCPEASDTTVLFIQAPEMVTLELPVLEPICDASDPVSLSASPAGGFWTGVGIDSSGLFDPGLSGLGTYSLQYQILDGACTYGDSLSIEVLSGQSVTTSAVLSLCENDTVVQLQFSPGGGNWTGTGITDPVQGLFDPQLSGAGAFDLMYELTDPSGCLINKETAVEVQALPVVMAPDTSAFCVDAGTIVLFDELTPTSVPAGGEFSWSGDGITDSTNGSFSSPGAGTYSIQLNYALDLCTASEDVIISIINPEAAVAGPDQDLCISEEMTTLTASPAGGRWSGPGVINAFSGEVDLMLAGSGMHEFTYTIAEGSSCEVSDILILNIQGPGNLSAGADIDFCLGDGEQALPAATPAGGTWSGPALNDPDQGIINTDQLALNTTFWYHYSISNSSSGCSFSDSVAVRVLPQPTVDLELPSYACANESIQLSTGSQTDITHNWIINENEFFSGDSIELNITAAGIYPISLSAVNTAGCSNSANGNLVISALPEPAFVIPENEGCGPLLIDFDDNSSGIDMQYNWDFGNGTTSTQTDPTDILFLPGIFDTTYHISLDVNNLCGTASYTDTVRVLARPVAGFGIPVEQGCGPLEINFANVSTGTADTYFWDFGNGSTSTDSLPVNQIYTTSDTADTVYEILLIATNSCGSDSISRALLVQASNVTSFFGVDNTQGCEPLNVNFTNYSSFGANVSWNFGDGNTSTLPTLEHTFDSAGYYTVFQYVNTACGSDSMAMSIEVLPAPDALFAYPPTVCPDQSISFENLSSEFLTIFWDFGDGHNSTAIAPEHTFDSPGTYPVTMVISNSAYLCQSTYSSMITVLEQPESRLLSQDQSSCPPLDICFESESNGAIFFEWDFGDGNGSSSLNPCHSYTESGQYRVSFRTADEQGCFSAYDTITMLVFDEPVADFSIPEDVFCGTNQSIEFTNTSTGASSYTWTLSNGISSNLSEPTINFNQTGSYQVELVASNVFNCQDETQGSFRILPQPLADFAPILIDDCAPQTVIFDNASINTTNYWWDFGNGETSADPNPVVSYLEAGNYDVSLIASYEDLCFDSLNLSGSVNLLNRPDAAFNWETATVPYRGIVQFLNESQDAVEYVWNFGDGQTSNEINPVHDYQGNGSWQTTLVAIAANGCIDTALLTIEPEFIYDIFFPNALSPESGEGDVRLFKPVGIGLAEWALEIYSPWGQRVFFSDKLIEDQPAASWDGRYKGEILPQGAYAYKATVEYLNGIQRIYTGSVTIIR